MARRDPIQANAFRIACSNTIQQAKLPSPNLNVRMRQALKTLRANQAISILSADKGGKVVVLDTNQYTSMCLEHLEDDAYELVCSFGTGWRSVVLRNEKGEMVQEFMGEDYEELDASDKLLRLQCRWLTDKLRKFRDEKQMTDQDRKRTVLAQPFSGIIPQFYGAPKIHKLGHLKIRLIVSNIGIYCDKLLIHLKGVLNVLFRSDYVVLNSYDFVNRLAKVEVTLEDRLASLDVQSLFTRVPVAQTLDIVKHRMDRMRETEEGLEQLEAVTSLTTEAFMVLLQMMVQDFYFQWGKKLYRQKARLPMGNQLSLVLANIFMEEIETTVLSTFPTEPKMYVRFVDDIFLIYDPRSFDLQEFLELYNDQHSDICLTSELENERQLPYLDILIKRTNQTSGQKSLDLSIYRKATHSHKFLHYDSCNPLSLKRNVFRGLYLRARRLLKNHPASLQ